MSKHQIQPLQYITHGAPEEQIQQAKAACEAGARWIQLRLKNVSDITLLQTALEIKAICVEYNAVFIVNDHVHIAIAADADGVHLGKEDSTPTDARILLGPDKIIGGTSNTLEDIEQLAAASVDYIGLGPYRFTTTKEKLSPVLGTEGYVNILLAMKQKNITIPVIAIGGIQNEDVEELMQTGIYGVAVSSAITHSMNKPDTIQSFHSALKTKDHGTFNHSR
ncbi:MAG: thiamine-phosphate pyrophosphorylase [Cytophagaceae bacterium]|jgi:thiamine-phosphate pyrophosphorylase|nr:thiamine-phosphate pyrophosphorylase [Cytophagaceae bacterium]